MKKRKVLIILTVVLVAAFGFIPLHVLQIDAVREERPVFVRTVRPGDEFSLGYIHSVELSPVRDYFRVDESYGIVLYETTFRSLNTGLPSTLAGNERLIREGDHFRVSGMNRALPFIDLQVHEKTDNTLIFGGVESFKLHTLSGDTLLRIRIHKTCLWRYLYLRTKTV
jgi:hypothetical protein